MADPLRWRCRPADRAEISPPAANAVLEAVSRSELSFSAETVGLSGLQEETIFSATSSERRGRMTIERSAFAFGRDQSFIFDEGLTSATVSPPPPFGGSASFLRNPDGTTSWAGDLRVDFPVLRTAHLSTAASLHA